jgi:hypothetical protein
VKPLVVRGCAVPGARFSGAAPAFEPQVVVRDRHLDAGAIRRTLPVGAAPAEDTLVDAIFDESGSMLGSDAARHRREAHLIGVDHLARSGRRPVRWHLRNTTFDCSGPVDQGTTKLDRNGLRSAERSLLAASPGGSSNLGPSLGAVEAAGFPGRRLLVVYSDFQLFDPDPERVLADLVTSTADAVLAVVFRSTVPPRLRGTRVRVLEVSEGTTPADIARAVVDAALTLVPGRRAA